MKELKIGETITIKCVEDEIEVDNMIQSFGDCSACFFRCENCDSLRKRCGKKYRTDGKNVHFEIVENPQKKWLDKAVKYIDENVGTMTAIALRKFMEESK